VRQHTDRYYESASVGSTRPRPEAARRAVARSAFEVMGISERTTSLHSVGHAEHVYSIAEGGTPPSGIEEVSSSWQRSANKYGVDPVDCNAPRILTASELKDFREPQDKLIFSAQEEIDQLYKVVRDAGYDILFCDRSGVAVEHRGEDAHASAFQYWGSWLGSVWSEELEGTNGIGTCIVEERPVTVHRTQHYKSRHIDLSCSGAPVFGVDGRLMAVLDVSAIDPQLSERAHALTGPLTVRSARAIEERFFSRTVSSRMDGRGCAARRRRVRHAAGN
jgi:transcriptional regulator of acetoin/glycerol metabolism